MSLHLCRYALINSFNWIVEHVDVFYAKLNRTNTHTLLPLVTEACFLNSLDQSICCWASVAWSTQHRGTFLLRVMFSSVFKTKSLQLLFLCLFLLTVTAVTTGHENGKNTNAETVKLFYWFNTAARCIQKWWIIPLMLVLIRFPHSFLDGSELSVMRQTTRFKDTSVECFLTAVQAVPSQWRETLKYLLNNNEGDVITASTKFSY